MKIHKTAIVSRKAKLGQDVIIGPYSIVNENVMIGSGTEIASHCFIDGNTAIGNNCEIFTGAVVGSRPQDLKYKGEKVFLDIGDNNIIREYCTLNPGTGDGGRTKIGSGNLFMAYSHIAHDCSVGNGCVFANNATLAGHVNVEDLAVIGGLVAIHQFVRIGKLSIIGGCSKVVQDIPPYSTCDGHPAAVYSLNLVGLKRNKVSHESIRELGYAYKIIFNSGFTPKHALEELGKAKIKSHEVKYLIDFVKGSKRGLSKSCRVEK
ncbi:MAG: acyl-ACP--UDP-N-acetylglucosamine O-acyltransferase [Candidatus Omnitrophica bacterium]|nr:acyl-ACP--UDP-N-acetylglucosamine O-acyltransferase [Candidatus Omnitrophota bacterium]